MHLLEKARHRQSLSTLPPGAAGDVPRFPRRCSFPAGGTMRLRHLILAVSLLGLAACQDSSLVDARPPENVLSKVTILKPEDYAARGIASLPMQPAGPSMVIRDPCEIDNPDSCGGGD